MQQIKTYISDYTFIFFSTPVSRLGVPPRSVLQQPRARAGSAVVPGSWGHGAGSKDHVVNEERVSVCVSDAVNSSLMALM